MDRTAFDQLAHRLSGTARRRALLAGLATVGLAGGVAAAPDAATAKKKKKKTTICRNGQTLSVVKKKKQKHLKPGDTAGACPAASTTARPGTTATSTSTTSTTPGPVCPSANLQQAINNAPSGSTLRLCAGTFRVTQTLEIEKDLTLIGAGEDQTILDGEDQVPVLVVGGSRTVTLEDLTITRGNAGADTSGGGIINNGNLTLRRMAVTLCAAVNGGGIINYLGSTLTMEAGSRLEGNTAADEGGGVANNQGTIIMNQGSRVVDNTAHRHGGGILTFGSLTLNAGSFVEHNTAVTGEGGGIRHASGPLTLKPDSVVRNNNPDQCQSTSGAC